MKFASVLGAAALALASTNANAAVVALSNPGEIATSYVNDFESVINSGPVTFSGVQLGSSFSFSGGVTSSGTQGLGSDSYPDSIVATLSSGYKAVGMYFGNDDLCCSSGFDAVLSVFDGATFLGSVSVAANMNDYADQFIGLSSDTAFNKVVISYSGASLYNFIDDFRLGEAGAVPEPSTWAMMLAGFGAVGFAMRRRKTRTSVAFA